MPAWKYYATERSQYPEVRATSLTRNQMAEVTDALCRHFGAEPLKVFFSDKLDAQGARLLPPGKSARGRPASPRKSFFLPAHDLRGRKAYFLYGIGMFNALTVAHEVAHYLHDLEHKKQNAALREQNKTHMASGDYHLLVRIPKLAHHGPDHSRWMRDCVAALRTLGYVAPPPPPVGYFLSLRGTSLP